MLVQVQQSTKSCIAADSEAAVDLMEGRLVAQAGFDNCLKVQKAEYMQKAKELGKEMRQVELEVDIALAMDFAFGLEHLHKSLMWHHRSILAGRVAGVDSHKSLMIPY